MKIALKNSPRKYQMGGAMPAEAPVEEPAMEAPAPEEGAMPEQEEAQDPMMMLAQMSMQALQSQDCQMAMQVCQAFLELLQQAQGGAPEEPQGEPVFRRGGVLVRRIKK